MSRTFWMAVGAVGGVMAYRKSVQVAARARELGPLGSAQAVAAGTSRAAGRTANGLGRLVEARERRAGRLLSGSATDRTELPAPRPGEGVPADWAVLPEDLAAGNTSTGTTPGRGEKEPRR